VAEQAGPIPIYGICVADSAHGRYASGRHAGVRAASSVLLRFRRYATEGVSIRAKQLWSSLRRRRRSRRANRSGLHESGARYEAV